MFTIGLLYHFFGYPSREELAAAIEIAPQKVAPFQALHLQVAVKFIFNVLLFEPPTEAQAEELSSLIQSVWLSAVVQEKTKPFLASEFLVTASIVDLPTGNSLLN